MARYTGPTTRISRRFGQHILGSGKAFERRGYPPGVHGAKMRRKVSEYAVGLNEKQKLRYIYGLLERQFRRVFEKDRKSTRLNSSHDQISYAVFCLKKKKKYQQQLANTRPSN